VQCREALMRLLPVRPLLDPFLQTDDALFKIDLFLLYKGWFAAQMESLELSSPRVSIRHPQGASSHGSSRVGSRNYVLSGTGSWSQALAGPELPLVTRPPCGPERARACGPCRHVLRPDARMLAAAHHRTFQSKPQEP
jgi:hypothetical protein